MKLSIWVILICMVQSLSGQQKIVVDIKHMLGEDEFQFNQTSQNNLDHYFTLRRMDYYLSDFRIIHSGGQVLEVPNSVFLVSLDENEKMTTLDLGLLKVENIEKLSFMFGLDSVTNHSDPALYQVGHPLGPRFPTMHWGWASGYRFIAVEGKAGPANNQEMQLHALGDQYYQPFTFEVSPKISGDTVKFELIANYRELFYNISIKQGVIVHGSDKEIIFMVDNLLQRVFSAPISNASDDEYLLSNVTLYPNPTQGHLYIKSETAKDQPSSIILYNHTGQKILQESASESVNFTQIPPGLYWLHLMNSDGKTIQIKPLTIVP